MSATYTYTIYDADPNMSGSCAWPQAVGIEIDADSDDEARDKVCSVLEIEASGLSEADGYSAGDRLWADVWDTDGTIIAQLTYELTADDLS